eukprot:CAMPEP_0197235612 /NCGR_PEP_ID=MMETSP1429-20130617/2997_1 /TAXON_ID=49237 /ORGANISM="Chaetoceros  sp., Strain UNC1202" /LENGTH=155 /DNA_ID=CAMNT_0042694241 /DNA_START=1 /DNA_END=466 /DNA_ORIENTATION=+
MRFNLSNDHSLVWAGPGTTLIKRDEGGSCRGFAFLTFYSKDGADNIVDRINNGSEGSNDDSEKVKNYPFQLTAELSNPKGAKERKKAKGQDGSSSAHLPDIRIKKQRRAPIGNTLLLPAQTEKERILGIKPNDHERCDLNPKFDCVYDFNYVVLE